MSRTADPQHRPLRTAMTERVVVADGAMGSMLQGSDATLDDFDGHEGCNEILNVTRPDIVRSIHDGYLDAGVDAISTNTFGANLGNLGEYGISDRIYELSLAGAVIAREAADQAAADGRPRWVLGSIGPGTKLPTLGHASFAALRDAYQVNAAGLLAGGADALIVETCQDLLQAKAAIIGAKRAIAAAGPGGSDTGTPPDIVLIAQVTIETTGSMLLGSEIGAALTALEPLGIDVISPRTRGSRCPACRTPACPSSPRTAPTTRSPLPSWPARTRRSQLSSGSPSSAAAAAPPPSTWPRSPRGSRAGRSRSAGRAQSPASPRSTSTCRSARTLRSWRSASGPTPTGRKPSAMR
jgi:methionine synthase I (cobalamin-dependent)